MAVKLRVERLTRARALVAWTREERPSRRPFAIFVLNQRRMPRR